MAHSASKEATKRYRVYRPRYSDETSYLAIAPEWLSAANFLSLDGRPVGQDWRQPEVFIPEPLKPSWDVTLLGLAIVLTPDARKKIKSHLGFYGDAIELLPIVRGETSYSLINVTYVPDCLKTDECKFRSSGTVEHYAFYPRRIRHSLFKIIPEAKGGVLIAEDIERPYASFKWQVEQAGLRGLKFKLLWEGD